MEGRVITPFYIVTDKEVWKDKLSWEFELSLPDLYVGIECKSDGCYIYFNRNLTSEEVIQVNSLIDSHTVSGSFGVKILDLVEDESKNKNYMAIDYKVETLTSLYPKRIFVQGELQGVSWYSDSSLTDLIIKTEINYIRDSFGFATSRTTVRTWYAYGDTPMPAQKITTKIYTPLEMIKEGKRRRGNIVDGVQLPVFAFLQEVLAKSPYNKSVTEILLMGRDFMDRFSNQFKNFVDNSSTITDPNDPNVGRKSVIVAFEDASSTTDSWLLEPVTHLGGASVLQYLTGEFSI